MKTRRVQRVIRKAICEVLDQRLLLSSVSASSFTVPTTVNLPVTISSTTVLANSNNAAGVIAYGSASNGTVSNSATGVTYTPDTGFVGTDSFSYTVGAPGEQAVLSLPIGASGSAIQFGLDSFSIGYTASGTTLDYDGLQLELSLSAGEPEISSLLDRNAILSSATVTVYNNGQSTVKYTMGQFQILTDNVSAEGNSLSEESTQATYSSLQITGYPAAVGTAPASNQELSFTDPKSNLSYQIPIESSSFSLTNPESLTDKQGAGAQLSNYSTFTLNDTGLSAGVLDLQQLGLTGATLPSASVTDYNSGGDAVDTYFLQNVQLVSFSSQYVASTPLPTEQLGLDFVSMTQAFSPGTAAASVGTFNQAAQDTTPASGSTPPAGSPQAQTGTATASSTAVVAPAGPVAPAPVIGAIAVQSFSVDTTKISEVGSNSSTGSATQTVTFSANVGADGPAWLEDAGLGSNYSSITLTQQRMGAGYATLTVTLSGAYVSGYSIESELGQDTETVTLITTSTDEQYTPSQPNGSAGTTIDRSYNFVNKSSTSNSVSVINTVAPTANHAVVSIFAGDGTLVDELIPTSYSFGVTAPNNIGSSNGSGGGKVTFSDLTLDFAASTQTPLFFVGTAAAQSFGDATLDVYGSSTSSPLEELKFALVMQDSDRVNYASGGAGASEQVSLAYGSVRLPSPAPMNSGSGIANSQTLTFYQSQTSSGVILPVTESSFGIQQQSNGKFTTSLFSLSTAVSGTTAQLSADCANSTILPIATLTDYGPAGTAVATYTLQTVQVLNDAQSGGSEGTPVETFMVEYGALTVDDLPSSVVNYNFLTKSTTPPTTTPPAPTGTPVPGGSSSGIISTTPLVLSLNAPSGTVAVGPVIAESFEFTQESSGTSQGKIALPQLTLTVPLGADAPDWFADFTTGKNFTSATLTEKDSNGDVLAQWTLGNANISSYAITGGSQQSPSLETIVLVGTQSIITANPPAAGTGNGSVSANFNNANSYLSVTGTPTSTAVPTATAVINLTVYPQPLVLTGLNEYLKLDSNGYSLDVYPSTSPTGPFTQYSYAALLGSVVIAPATPGTGVATIDFSAGVPVSGTVQIDGSSAGVSLSAVIVGTTGNDTLVSTAGGDLFNGQPISFTDVTGTTYIGSGGVDAINAASGTLTIPASSGTGVAVDTLSSFNIASGANVLIAQASSHANRTLIQTASLIDSGTLNLSGNDLDVTAGSLSSINALVKSGYSGGAVPWSGNGIDSSVAANDTTHLTALGVIQNNQSGAVLFTAANPFDGITPGTNDVLVKYTYYGDANLDGNVDGSDYSRIDNGFVSKGALTGWFNGDFNYDGVINGSDYTLIDNAFNSQGASLASQLLATPQRSAAPTTLLGRQNFMAPQAAFSDQPIAAQNADDIDNDPEAANSVVDAIFGTTSDGNDRRDSKRGYFES